MQLYKIRNGYNLDTDAVVHFTRKILSDGLRKPGSQLYYLDFLATCIKAPIVSHGYGGFLCMGILDQFHKPTLSEVQAYDILKLCVHEIHRRFIYSLQDFQVKVVCKSGTHELPTITKI
ncbi:Proteasome subunit beta type [Operophtera brumata]|uniref:Proteasome subunit beta type n=1 Tax=Operophtera brumata TaxID=104452 RepID=A0A0L7LFK0_OPEBR|nr:Proteasome subunit beta type [Operophtera brumata]